MMKINTSKPVILCVLAILFLAPGIAAYLFYQHPDWLSTSKVNKGLLLQSPLLLTTLENQNTWCILLWNSEACNKTCIKQLDTIYKVRLALGRKFYDVDLVLLSNKDTPALTNEFQNLLKKYHINNIVLTSKDKKKLISLASKNKVFIVNPQGYVILAYKIPINPDDIYKDIKLLLNSQTQNG